MRDIFLRWETPRLRGHLVWIPMLPADNLDAALFEEGLFQDKRVTHYWDGERSLGKQVSQTLNLTEPVAWDIYLLYLPGAAWQREGIPPPDFWMQQTEGRHDLLLDPQRLMNEVWKAIERGN